MVYSNIQVEEPTEPYGYREGTRPTAKLNEDKIALGAAGEFLIYFREEVNACQARKRKTHFKILAAKAVDFLCLLHSGAPKYGERRDWSGLITR